MFQNRRRYQESILADWRMSRNTAPSEECRQLDVENLCTTQALTTRQGTIYAEPPTREETACLQNAVARQYINYCNRVNHTPPNIRPFTCRPEEAVKKPMIQQTGVQPLISINLQDVLLTNQQNEVPAVTEDMLCQAMRRTNTEISATDGNKSGLYPFSQRTPNFQALHHTRYVCS